MLYSIDINNLTNSISTKEKTPCFIVCAKTLSAESPSVTSVMAMSV